MHPPRHQRSATQRGIALIVMLVILVMGTATLLIGSFNSAALKTERDQRTTDALALAKEALMGYAASVDLTAITKRPGDLPCPDINNDGVAEIAACGNASGSTGQTLRLGRLPWKSLGLPDLRDSNGERLWYAVSNNFKNNSRTTCTAPGQAGCLNSDTLGTISVRKPDGSLQYNGSVAGGTGAVAVIFSPGEILQRTDKSTQQDRSAAGTNIASNYLDIANSEDNADFTDGSAANGFIQGRIKDGSGNTILNDRLLVITRDNIMQAIQKRVAAEVKLCLIEYAANGGSGFYPWATAPGDPSYTDTSGIQFGRIPNTPFSNTNASNVAMNDVWDAKCNIWSNTLGWWPNWKDMVFYGFAHAYAPLQSPGNLTVNPPSATADKKFVVIVAGKKLAGQIRSSVADKTTLSNYLEAPNSGGASAFAQQQPSTNFNDVVVFQ